MTDNFTTLNGSSSHDSPVDVLSQPIAILGAGVSGLINAYVLLKDGFTNVTVITRDRSVGGVWCKDRVYPGLHINNVHGEYRFSPLEMPPPEDAAETGGHISGVGMCRYMETFYAQFLENKVNFKFETEILSVHRVDVGDWEVKVEDIRSPGEIKVLKFARIVLATGGCSSPKMPKELSVDAAEEAGFSGIVLHSSQFRTRLDEILELVKHKEEDDGAILVVGGGKSAKDMSAKLAREGRRVVNVFDTPDTFIASSITIPDFIRKSRFLSTLSPHINLNTRLERFLHTTTLGSWIVHFILGKLEATSLSAYSIPKDSPLRPKEGSLFWGIRTNDEGLANPKSFYSLVNAGEIRIIAPARAVGYEKASVVLDNGEKISAKVVILATGWQSSWTKIFDDATVSELGLGRHAPMTTSTADAKNLWKYKTLANPPPTHTGHLEQEYVTSLYRGLIPAKNINNRDFAVAGAIFSSNIGYTNEVAAHWISSYFQGDRMRLPASPEEALAESELRSAWMTRRYPNMLSWINESYSGTLDFWTWVQCADEMLEDMYLPSFRSGGNWLTWPFRVIDLKEISTLTEERRANR